MSDGTDVTSGNGAPAGVPITKFDDPHLQPYAKNPRRAEMLIGAILLIGLAGFCAYGGLYWVGGQTQWEAVFGGIGFFAFGFGLSAWGKYLLPQGPFVEDRHDLKSTEPEIEAMAAAIEDRGKMVFRRRGFLGTILGAGAGVMGVVITFPLIRSLGPQPKKTFDTTNWRSGSHVVDLDGRRIHRADLEVGGSLTVFPEGHQGSGVDQTMLIRADTKDITTLPGRDTWGPKGYLAYSKMCTHAGCPVGLYQQVAQQLLCPCHQSLFDVLTGGNPVFGPAPRPLPQLPLEIDSQGFLLAQAGYDQPVGPGFWERS
ncbi:MAG TPA: ubiquinol-cytochrome c reductase iron-sulfur subunit [Acidimicrobiales bacterium]|nr:ubiquinol-cytochrome c reductase iron-sulfur subunit [Acidimicrobiales bacterium]